MRDVIETVRTAPTNVSQSLRTDEIRGTTSCFAGRIIPHAYQVLLREDRVSRGDVTIDVDMAETVHPLLNGVAVTARATFVPFLAFDRFEGSLDRMNRSYEGKPDKEGGVTLPFFETVTYSRTHPFWRSLGVHAKNGAKVNSAPLEAYNALVNQRYSKISNKLTLRDRRDTSLAACPWKTSAEVFCEKMME